jgi:TRAP-type C4-dicarboxylate transport system permease large subunit
MLTVHLYAVRRGYPTYPKDSWVDFRCAVWRSLPALMTPFIIVGGILLGWFTATESAAAAVLYAAVLSIFFYREMDAKKLWDALLETGKLSAIALFCVGTASVFGWLLAYFQIPKALLENVTSWGLGLIGVGFFIAFVFLVVGCFLDAIRRSSSSARRCSRSPSPYTCIRCRSRSSSRWPSASSPRRTGFV